MTAAIEQAAGEKGTQPDLVTSIDYHRLPK
jgi:hypothetical protein